MMGHSPKITTQFTGGPQSGSKDYGSPRDRTQSPGQLNSMESTKSIISPSMRFPLPRALSPDLPTRDALYLFCNFSSYMRSPHEGAEGIRNHEDFRDTIRLLDHARGLAASEHHNVHVLHLKYRFSGQPSQFRSPYGDSHPSQSGSSGNGRLASASQEPVPQPFSVMHDAVIKIDYKENGVFSPLPAQAVFTHLTSRTQPPPRIIVVSYISSRATQNHLASLSTWAIASTPPTYVFSPLETRIRETQPLPVALKYAIPMSMYAEPPGQSPCKPPMPQVPVACPVQTTTSRRLSGSDITATRGVSGIVQSASQPEKQYPPAPVASLSIEAGEGATAKVEGLPGSIAGRIPLWALASGVGVLNGSTSSSVGVKLEDFSAIKLVDAASTNEQHAAYGGDHASGKVSPNAGSALPPVEARHRSGTPSKAFVPADPIKHVGRLTMPSHLSPPEQQVVAMGPAAFTGSCPSSISKVIDWRKGRKETMEEVLRGAGLIRGTQELESEIGTLRLTDGGQTDSDERRLLHVRQRKLGRQEPFDTLDLL